jgi:hypothetical protein
MQPAVAEGNTTSKLIDSLELVVSIVFRAEEYASYLLTAEESADEVLGMLRKDIVHLYAHVLSFLVRARVFFGKPKPGWYFPSLYFIQASGTDQQK